MAEQTSTVWMFHAAGPSEGRKGTLSLDAGAVVFRSAQQGRREFPFHQIRKVRRVRGSPVLELHLRPSGGPRLVGFYFVQPPSLQAQEDSGVFAKRRLRRTAAFSLMRLNAVKRDEIEGWVDAISRALEG